MGAFASLPATYLEPHYKSLYKQGRTLKSRHLTASSGECSGTEPVGCTFMLPLGALLHCSLASALRPCLMLHCCPPHCTAYCFRVIAACPAVGLPGLAFAPQPAARLVGCPLSAPGTLQHCLAHTCDLRVTLFVALGCLQPRSSLGACLQAFLRDVRRPPHQRSPPLQPQRVSQAPKSSCLMWYPWA